LDDKKIHNLASCCQEGETCCRFRGKNFCANLNDTASACGACDNVCKADEVCVNGGCGRPSTPKTCPPGSHLCSDMTCQSCCVDQQCRDDTGMVNIYCMRSSDGQRRCECLSGSRPCPELGRCIENGTCCTSADCPPASCPECTVCADTNVGNFCVRPS
jgi:hypothetical protein